LVGAVLALSTSTLGILPIPAIYLPGARAFGRRVGLLAAAFLAVSPLHSFHSHYPYRDVPMVLALTLTLTACIALATRPSALIYAAAAVGAGLTIALKPAGLVLTPPLATALLLARRRPPALWVAGAGRHAAGGGGRRGGGRRPGREEPVPVGPLVLPRRGGPGEAPLRDGIPPAPATGRRSRRGARAPDPPGLAGMAHAPRIRCRDGPGGVAT